ncbi:MAG TPA: hypothetical protein VH856_05445 [Steroidobacteraceae bacterium]|jgi:hypothetical protein
MKGIGGLLVLLGAGSFVLNMMDREFTVISWIDNWGPAVGVAIRVVMIVAGAALWFLGNRKEKGTAAT